MTTDDDMDDGYVLIIESAPGVMYAHIWIPAPYYTEADAQAMAAERAIAHSATVRLLHRGVELSCANMELSVRLPPGSRAGTEKMAARSLVTTLTGNDTAFI